MHTQLLLGVLLLLVASSATAQVRSISLQPNEAKYVFYSADPSYPTTLDVSVTWSNTRLIVVLHYCHVPSIGEWQYFHGVASILEIIEFKAQWEPGTVCAAYVWNADSSSARVDVAVKDSLLVANTNVQSPGSSNQSATRSFVQPEAETAEEGVPWGFALGQIMEPSSPPPGLPSPGRVT